MSVKPMTGDEQRAAMDNVRRDPMQRDMFTGELSGKPPKRGNGSHIQFRQTGIEKSIVPGMASYAGEGPEGKYCRDCEHYGQIAVCRPDETVEMNRGGCALWAQRMGHASPLSGKSIALSSSCKEFAGPATDQPRCFIVTTDGRIGRMREFPKRIRAWKPEGRG